MTPRVALPRHGLATRVLHFINALTVIALVLTGLAVAGWFADQVVAWAGGHVAINAVHRVLGLAFVAALVLVALVWPHHVAGLLRDVVQVRVHEVGWPLAFVRYLVRPRDCSAPFHAGRFDPAQRVVFAVLLGALALTAASGVYLYFAPPAGGPLLGWAIRVHILAAWVLIVCIGLHIVAGSGALWTHRGLIGAMFGDGRVSLARARVLWPGWTARQPGVARSDRLDAGVDSVRVRGH